MISGTHWEPSGSQVLLAPDGAEGGEPEGIQEPASAGEPETPTSFYDWPGPDGQTTSFANQEELGKYLTESTLRQSDYSRKQNDLSAREKQLSERIAANEKDAGAVSKIKAEFATFKDAMDKRPDLFKEFRDRIGQPASPEDAFGRARGYADERYSALEKKLDDALGRLDQRDSSDSKAKIVEKLVSELEGFDGEKVEAYLGNIENEEQLMRTAHFAIMGQNPSPVDAQAIADAQREGGERARGTTNRGSSTPPPEPKFETVDQAREYAHKME